MSNHPVLTPGQVRDLAESTWLIANEYAEKHGTGITKNDRSGHVVTVKGGTTRFIREAAKELGMQAYMKGKWERGKVREYLKNGYNIVTISRGSGQHEWRMFVSKDWKPGGAVVERQPVRHEYKVKDTGQSPGGESGPVEAANLWELFQSEPLGEDQAKIVRDLYERGGKVEDPTGFVLTDLGDYGSGSLRTLEEKGIVAFRKLNPRRWHTIELTQRGWWVAERLSYVQTADVAVAAFISRVGSFAGSTPKRTSAELAERVHKTAAAVGNALRALSDAGHLTVERSTEDGGGVYARVGPWSGELPGVHATPRVDPQEAMTASTPVETPKVENGPTKNREIEFPIETVSDPAITRDEAQGFVDQLTSILRGPSQEDLDRLRGALVRIKETTKDVESGDISALKAVVTIQDLTNEALG